MKRGNSVNVERYCRGKEWDWGRDKAMNNEGKR